MLTELLAHRIVLLRRFHGFAFDQRNRNVPLICMLMCIIGCNPNPRQAHDLYYDATGNTKSVEIKPIELRGSEKPLQVEASVKMMEENGATKPIEIAFPPEGMHVDGSVVPNKLTIAWDGSQPPLEIKWPKEAMPVLVEVKCDWEKLLGVVQSLYSNRPGTTLEATQPTEITAADLANLSEQLEGGWDTKFKDFQERNAAISAVKVPPGLSDDAWFLLRWVVLAGACGGVATTFVNWMKRRQKTSDALTGVKKNKIALWGSCDSTDPIDFDRSLGNLRSQEHKLKDELHGIWLDAWRELLPALVMGIIAALLVPAVLLFSPQQLIRAANNNFSCLSLFSCCVFAAMLGLPIIEIFLKRARALLDEKPTNGSAK